jgi:hypothetical protein
MKLTKQRLEKMIREELMNERLTTSDRKSLAERVSFLIMNAPIDEEAFAELTRLVHSLEEKFPIPEREPRPGEVQFFSREE